ncbi:MAG: sensor histidine kinase [Oligoflexales bacterium]
MEVIIKGEMIPSPLYFCKQLAELQKKKGMSYKNLLIDCSNKSRLYNEILENLEKKFDSIAVIICKKSMRGINRIIYKFLKEESRTRKFLNRKLAIDWLLANNQDDLNKTIKKESYYKQQKEAAFNLMATIGIFCSLFIGVAAFFTLNTKDLSITSGVFFLLSLLTKFLLRHFKLELCITLYIIIWFVCAVYAIENTGGLSGPVSYAIIPIPLMALFFFSIFNTLLFTSGVIAYSVLSFYFSESNQDSLYLILIISIIIANLSIGTFFKEYMEKLNREARNIVKSSVDVLNTYKSNDFSKQVGKSNIRAFNELADGINTLGETLNSSLESLGDYQEKLEVKIIERTKKLKFTQEALVESSKLAALGEMSAGISHEINTPLAVIKTRASQICRLVAKDSFDKQQIKEFAGIIEQGSDKISKIVDGLKTFARDSTSDPFISVFMSRLVDEAISFSRHQVQKNGAELYITNIPIDVSITCKPGQIEQVLMNLLGNALDAIEGLDNKWIKIDFEESDEFFKLRITDSGSGISKEIRRKMMQPFYTTKEIGKGTGLGLSLSRGIMEHHQGSLSYDEKNRNTCFVLSFPKKFMDLLSNKKAG